MAEINKTTFKGLGLPEHFDPSLDALKDNMNLIDVLLQKAVPNEPASVSSDTAEDNINILVEPGRYYTKVNATGYPVSGLAGIVDVTRVGSYVLQEWRSVHTNTTVHFTFRRFRSGSIWSAWVKDWNASNDGSNSGLDADLLDANDSSAFAKVNQSTSNFNSATTPGFWYISSATNAPSTSFTTWGCVVFRTGSATSNTYLVQIASPRGTSDTHTSTNNTLGLFYRKYFNGTWLSWNTIWDSSRNSSGINAQYLSGYTWDDLNIPTIIGSSSTSSATPIDDTYGTQGSEHTPLLYVKSGYFKIGSGDTDFLQAPALITIEPYSAGNSDEVILFDSADLVTVINYSGIMTYKVYFGSYTSTEVATRLNVTQLNGYYGDEYTLKSEILNELKAVDGDGSGLDSDLLDGLHKHGFTLNKGMTSELKTLEDGATDGSSQVYLFMDMNNVIGGGGMMYYVIIQFYYSSSVYARFAIPTSSNDKKVYKQSDSGGAWTVVGDITADNLLSSILDIDGTGSGIDADLLDGRQGSGFVTHSGFITGTLPTTNIPSTVYSTYNQGQSTIYFYQDTNNVIGGGVGETYTIIHVRPNINQYYTMLALGVSNGKLYRKTSSKTAWNEITQNIPVVSSDPSNPSEGQLWIRSDLQ